MRLITIAAFSLLLGCSTLPAKPVVSVGALELVPAARIIEGLSDGSDPLHPVDLSEYDKATCFKPRAWEQEKAYIKLLEDFANRCRYVDGGAK